MSVDPLTISALIIGLVGMAIAIRRERSRPLAPAMSREQELLNRVAVLERDIVGLQRMLTEKQTEIDRLNERIRQLERNAVPDHQSASDKTRRILLVGVGEDNMLKDDLAQLRGIQSKTDIRISRLLPVTMANLARTLDRHRAAGNPIRLLHLAVHSDPQGLAFKDGIATGHWLSEHLADVEIVVLAGCSNDRVADLLAVVPAVISMREDVHNEAASIFSHAFWLAIGQHKDVSTAFDYALLRAPAVVSEFVELHLL